MKRTNRQVLDFCERTLRKYWHDNERIRERILAYWIRYNLTQHQTNILEHVKNNCKMPTVECEVCNE